MDYKNTPEGRSVQSKYGKILHASRPEPPHRIELSEEGKQALNKKIGQLRKGQEIIIKYFTDGYYENVAGVLDAVDVINKELRIYTGFINDTGKELPTIIAFEDILEIGVNMT